MIGELVQHILDKGFFVRFTYDDNLEYHFRAWKYYGDTTCNCQWIVGDFSASPDIVVKVAIMEADRYLKLVDDNIAQRNLINSAFK